MDTDTGTDSDSTDTGTDTNSSTPTDSDNVSTQGVAQDDYDKLARASKWAHEEVRRLRGTVKNLETRVDTTDDKTSGDSKNKLQNALTEIEQLKKDKARLTTELRDRTVKDSVRQKLAGKIRDDAFDAFWKVEGDSFGELDSGGIGIVDKPYMTWEDITQQVVTEHSYFAANPRKAGGDIPKGDNNASGDSGRSSEAGKPTIEELESMPYRERVTAMAKWPELQKELITARGG